GDDRPRYSYCALTSCAICLRSDASPSPRKLTSESLMKIVLLVLSGDANRFHDLLETELPAAEIKYISRDQIEASNLPGRLRALRALHPDIFVIATERLAWQRGQNPLLLFGALAGAHRGIIIDAHGGIRQESRSATLTK